MKISPVGQLIAVVGSAASIIGTIFALFFWAETHWPTRKEFRLYAFESYIRDQEILMKLAETPEEKALYDAAIKANECQILILHGVRDSC